MTEKSRWRQEEEQEQQQEQQQQQQPQQQQQQQQQKQPKGSLLISEKCWDERSEKTTDSSGIGG